MKKIKTPNLESYIKNEQPQVKQEYSAEEKKRQAQIYLGMVSCGNLMLDWIDELESMGNKVGMRPSDEMMKGKEGMEVFIHELTSIFSGILDTNSNTSMTEIQNRIEYTIKKEIKYVPQYLKR